MGTDNETDALHFSFSHFFSFIKAMFSEYNINMFISSRGPFY